MSDRYLFEESMDHSIWHLREELDHLMDVHHKRGKISTDQLKDLVRINDRLTSFLVGVAV